MDIHISEQNENLFNQVDGVFGAYLKGQKNLKAFSCQQHARALKGKLELEAPNASYSFGKVTTENANGNLMHKSGGVFSSHHLVLSEVEGKVYALDPFMKELSIHPIPVDLYISRAFENSHEIEWVESNLTD